MKSFFHRRLFFLLIGWIFALPIGSDAAKKWRDWPDCTLIENESNDGDSLHIRHKKRHYIFRLYFVDTPETDDRYPDRVKDQADYFGISSQDAIRIGKEAQEFSAKFLKDGCTIFTRLEDAMGASSRDRDYALIRVGDKDLGEELVRNGLARIFGNDAELPDFADNTAKTYEWRLKSAERDAKKELLGAWKIAAKAAPKDPFAQLNTQTEIQPQDLILQQSIAVFSQTPPNQQMGILQRGAVIKVIGTASSGMVKIHFKTPSGTEYDALCRRSDLNL